MLKYNMLNVLDACVFGGDLHYATGRSLYRNEVASHVYTGQLRTYINFDLSPLEAGNAANLFDVALQKTTTSYNMQSHFTVS